MDDMTTSINGVLKNLITNFNTLLDCPARFPGEFNEKNVHCFVEYIEYYKRKKCIGDSQALQELQYLLLDQAYDWWMRRKESIDTWSEALTILENRYSKKRPANVIYAEILQHPFEKYESTDDFLDDKIELFSELCQPELKENNKLEIIYTLLPNDIQNKINLKDITRFTDLKKQLKLVKLENGNVSTIQANTILNSGTTSGANSVTKEVESINIQEKESDCQESTNEISIVSISSEKDKSADSTIKVRRTEDLMPEDVKEEEKSPLQSEEFIANDNVSSPINNTMSTCNENFQIDTDIMNQIDNIIDESEMSINTINNNQAASQSLSQSLRSVTSLEFLGFQIEASKQQEYSDHQIKSAINSTKKVKKRCTYCRHFNHTAQACLKRAKQMKLFPERFKQTEEHADNENPPETVPPIDIFSNNLSSIHTQSPGTCATIPNTNPTSTTITAAIELSPSITTSTVTLNNITEKSINTILTTKLIAPINGKAPNKMLAAKLRNISIPSPKCHQCGNLGFYKSICPNCSPIYSNNSHR